MAKNEPIMMHIHPIMGRLLTLIAATFFLIGCGTKQSVVETETKPTSQWASRVQQQKQTAEAQTAHINLQLRHGDKNLSCSGSLRMKRDQVVQLSLTFLGLEIGRLECTPAEVLIIDKINKQYIRAPYSEVDLLRTSGLDFYALQALLRCELFVPGSPDPSSQLYRFKSTESGDHVLLALSDAPELQYDYIVARKNATISRFEATPKQGNTTMGFVCRYANFTALNGHSVPQQLVMELKGASKPTELTLSLSRLSTNANWESTTTVKSSYTRLANPNKLLSQLLQIAK